MEFFIDNEVTVLLQQCISCMTVKMFELIPKLLSIVTVVIWDVTEVW